MTYDGYMINKRHERRQTLVLYTYLPTQSIF